MQLKKFLLHLLNKLPYVKTLYEENKLYKKNSCYPAGHFYSPIVQVDDIKSRESEIWINENNTIEGIDLQTENQIQLLKQLSKYYKEQPFQETKQSLRRYYFENDHYSYSDGILLYSIIRHIKPKKIIEIGSGFSSALMLDINEIFFDSQIKITLIEPHPERLYSLITDADRDKTTICENEVQSISLEIFASLNAGDILFIDSSHVVKTGSDVNFIIFSVLPILKKGVLIHFHDIGYNFEYPKDWVYGGRNWNENYFLKSFLMYNSIFKIRLFSAYMHVHYRNSFEDMPLVYKNPGGNLWLEKII